MGELSGRTLLIDGYNVLTTIEAALAGGIILHARDGCFRDMASMHGTWRKVEETLPAVELIGSFLAGSEVARVVWYLDSPVSNSGRLKTVLRQIAASRNWPWTVELVLDPDQILASADDVIATADSQILDSCKRWINLAREVVEKGVPTASVVEM